MSKRQCPFEENCAPQRKVYLSAAHMNRQNECYMKELEAKTMEMLHKGANNQPSTSVQPPPRPVTDTCPSCKGPPIFVATCSFCVVSLCKDCLRICAYCHESFCDSCSVAIYKHGKQYTCLTCYT